MKVGLVPLRSNSHDNPMKLPDWTDVDAVESDFVMFSYIFLKNSKTFTG